MALAGDRLDSVVNYELHRRVAPSDLTRASLDRILALNNRTAIVRIASLPPEARDTLFNLNSDDLNALLKALSGDELKALAGYLRGLQPGPRDKVLKAVAARPGQNADFGNRKRPRTDHREQRSGRSRRHDARTGERALAARIH